MKSDNPNNRTNQFEVVRVGHAIEVWLPPVNHPEGVRIINPLDTVWIPSLIAALKKFEQSEGR